MKRPRQIFWFELLLIASIAFGLANAIIGWRQITVPYQNMSAHPFRIATLIIVVTFGLVLLLTLLASRRRNAAAMVLLLLFFLGGLPHIVRHLIETGLPGTSPLTLLGLIAQAAAFALAGTAPARRWFSGRWDNDRAVVVTNPEPF